MSPVFLKCLPSEKLEVVSDFHLCFPVADVSVCVSCCLIPGSVFSEALEPVLYFHCFFKLTYGYYVFSSSFSFCVLTFFLMSSVTAEFFSSMHTCLSAVSSFVSVPASIRGKI